MVLDSEWTERIYYGGNLPREAERLIHLAALSYSEEAVAEKYLKEALAQAPDHIAVYIGLYKFYFYKGKLEQALQYAVLCLERAARESGLSANWRNVRIDEAEFEGFNASPRFFLFTLKAYGYIQMRLGNLEEGRFAIAKVMELDPRDNLGGSVLMGVLDRIGEDENE